MDLIEKVLNNLIDNMHKHIANGHSKKKVDTSKEIAKATTAVEEPKKEDKSEPQEESIFDRFLKSNNSRVDKPKRKEVIVSSPSSNIKEKFTSVKKAKR